MRTQRRTTASSWRARSHSRPPPMGSARRRRRHRRRGRREPDSARRGGARVALDRRAPPRLQRPGATTSASDQTPSSAQRAARLPASDDDGDRADFAADLAAALGVSADKVRSAFDKLHQQREDRFEDHMGPRDLPPPPRWRALRLRPAAPRSREGARRDEERARKALARGRAEGRATGSSSTARSSPQFLADRFNLDVDKVLEALPAEGPPTKVRASPRTTGPSLISSRRPSPPSPTGSGSSSRTTLHVRGGSRADSAAAAGLAGTGSRRATPCSPPPATTRATSSSGSPPPTSARSTPASTRARRTPSSKGLIGQVEPKLVVTDENLDGCSRAPGGSTGRARPTHDDPAVLIPTSGTTGRSKLVTQTHRAYAMAGEGFPSWLGLTEDDRLMTSLPLFHINAPAYSVLGSVAAAREPRPAPALLRERVPRLGPPPRRDASSTRSARCSRSSCASPSGRTTPTTRCGSPTPAPAAGGAPPRVRAPLRPRARCRATRCPRPRTGRSGRAASARTARSASRASTRRSGR